jgi:hypothetical protein
MESSQGQDQGTGQQVADQAREKAGEAAEQAKQTAHNAASQAQDRIREQVDQRSTEAGERVNSTAQDIRSVSEELRNQGKDAPAKIADQTADRIERAGSYLRDSDADRILNDVEDFGRSRPWAVLAGAVVVGAAAARFLKASSRSRYSERQQRVEYAPYGDGGRQLSAPHTPATQTAVTTPSTPETTPVGVR